MAWLFGQKKEKVDSVVYSHILDGFIPEDYSFDLVARAKNRLRDIESALDLEFLVPGRVHKERIEEMIGRFTATSFRIPAPDPTRDERSRYYGTFIYYKDTSGIYAVHKKWEDPDGKETAKTRLVGLESKIVAFGGDAGIPVVIDSETF